MKIVLNEDCLSKTWTMFFESNYEKCRKDRFENAMYKATNTLTVTRLAHIPFGMSGQSWFLCSNIESSRRIGYVEVEGTRYKKGAEAETM